MRSPPRTASTAGASWGKPIAGPADHRPQPREKKGAGLPPAAGPHPSPPQAVQGPLLWLPRANTSTSTQCGVAASLQGSLGMMGCKPCDLRRREGDRTTARSAQPSAARAGSVGSPGKPEHPGKDLLSRGPFRFNQDFQGQRPRPLPGNVDPLRSSQREAGPWEGPRAPAVL